VNPAKRSLVILAIGSFLVLLVLLGFQRLNRDLDRIAGGVGKAAHSIAGGVKASTALLGLVAAVRTDGADRGSNRNATAQRCGVDLKKPVQRFFANPDGKKGWHEYRSIREVPELANDAGDFAALWEGPDGKFLVLMEEPGEDFAAYTDYCFDRKGRLLQLRFELRTAWGWGFREEGPVLKGAVVAQVSEFFDTKTEHTIQRPEVADEVPEALNPRLFLHREQLPFSSLLSKR